MPALDYILSGDSIGIIEMNRLFTEFERRMGLLLCGKSPLNVLSAADLTRDGKYAVGQVFQMSSLRTPDKRTWTITPGEAGYDHDVFTARAGAATPLSWDDTNQIAWCEYHGEDLDGSLQAHSLERAGLPYYIGYGDPTISGFVRPQRRYRYAVAELVCELDDTLIVPDSWDKYACFRIHNLAKRTALRVVFGGNCELTIPALECRTIRRTSVVGTYDVGTYFWAWQAGDPIGNQMGRAALRNPERTLEANNITNPSILIRWIELLTSANVRASFGWESDAAELCDLHQCASEYAALYAHLGTDNSLLGDCAVQRGAMHVVTMPSGGPAVIAPAIWTGFGVLPSALTRVDLADGACRIEAVSGDPTDIVCTGTNLAVEAGATWSIVELPITFAADLFEGEMRGAPVLATESTQMTWVKPTGETVAVTGSVSRITSEPTAAIAFGPMKTAGELGEVLAAWHGSITAAALTPEGAMLVIDEQVDFTVDGWSMPSGAQRSGDTLIGRSVVRIGSSWPGAAYPHVMGLCGRVDRVVSALRAGYSFSGSIHWEHPDVSGDVITRAGADIEFLEAPRPGSRVPVHVQVPIASAEVAALDQVTGESWIAQNPSNPVFHCVLSPDNLVSFLGHCTDAAWYEDHRETLIGPNIETEERFEFLRIPLTLEHWNHLAWRVNQLTRGCPLTIEDLFWYVPGEVPRKLVPNSGGMTDSAGAETSIRPINQYARMAVDYVQDLLIGEMGLPVLTDADLPQDFRTAAAYVSAGGNMQAWKVVIRRTYGTAETIVGSPSYLQMLRCPGTDRYIGVTRYSGELGGIDPDGWETGGQPWIYAGQPGYRWVSVDAVSDLAAELGVGFVHAAVGRPIAVQITDSVAPEVTAWSAKVATGYHETGWYDTSGGTYEIDAARESISGKSYDISTIIGVPKRSIRLVECDAVLDATLIADGDYLGYSAPRSDTRLDADVVVIEDGENVELTYYGAEPQNLFQPFDPFACAPWPSPAPSAVQLVLWDGVLQSVRSIEANEHRTLGLVWSSVLATVNASFAVLTPASTWTRAPLQAGSSSAAFELHRSYGLLAREPRFHPADPQLAKVVSLSASDTVGPDDGLRAAFVLIVPDITRSLL